MNLAQFGDLTVGAIPRVVGTLSSFVSLQGFASVSEKFCDLVEVRLDRIGVDTEWLPACKAVEACGTPVIVTLRAATEGGHSHLPNNERLTVLRRALDHVSAVDVELKSGLAASLSEIAEAKNKCLLVSFHDFERTPAYTELETIVRDAAQQASIVKVSTTVKSHADSDLLERLLREDWGVPMCVIGMGSLGALTRTSFPCLGSCLTYGYLDTPAAPGQLSARSLVDHLRSALPKYNEEYSIRHKISEFVQGAS